MKISTKGQYALEALLDLYLHAVNGQENLKSIAGRRGISEHYLEQIFAVLRKTGIVASVRGAQGSYRLAKNPADITAGEVIRSLEGPLCPVKCVCSSADNDKSCPMINCCATRTLWAAVTEEIDSAVDSVTLEDLLKAYSRLAGENAPEYSI